MGSGVQIYACRSKQQRLAIYFRMTRKQEPKATYGQNTPSKGTSPMTYLLPTGYHFPVVPGAGDQALNTKSLRDT